jgi:hypothetical protein
MIRSLALIAIVLFGAWAIVGGWALLIAAVLVLLAEVWMASRCDRNVDALSAALPPDERGRVP